MFKLSFEIPTGKFCNDKNIECMVILNGYCKYYKKYLGYEKFNGYIKCNDCKENINIVEI